MKKPEGLNLNIVEGLAEESLKTISPGTIVQFYRFGFVKIDRLVSNKVIAYFAHE